MDCDELIWRRMKKAQPIQWIDVEWKNVTHLMDWHQMKKHNPSNGLISRE
jgi:hypothetical protein